MIPLKSLRLLLLPVLLFSAVSLYSQTTAWTRLHPLPQAHDILDIQKIPGTNRLIAACKNSTVMISDNAGETWQTISYPGNQPYYFDPVSFYFLNDHVGFLYGGYSNILKTTDAGMTWQVQYQNNDDWLESVSDMDFLTDSVGFAITQFRVLLKTTDQGETWQPVNTGFPYNNGLLISLEFTGNKGFITSTVGGEVLISEDGGTTWTYRSTNEIIPGTTSINTIQFITSTTGFIACNDGIYKTVNAGLNWQKVHTESNGFFKYAFEFVNSTHGIAFSTPNYFPYKLLITSDGGETWQQADQSQLKIPCNDLVYYDQNLIYTGGPAGSMFKSVNGGLNWQNVSHNLFTGPIADPVVFDENNAVMVQYNKSQDTSYVIKTTDGFLTFDTLISIPCKNYPSDVSVELEFPDPNHGFCLVTKQGHLLSYRTSDGGITWVSNTIADNVGYNTPYHLTFCNSAKGIIYSKSRWFITLNGGESWQEKYYFSNFQVSEIWFPSTSMIYMSGKLNNKEGMIKSDDNGDSWQIVTYDLPNTLLGDPRIYFRNEMTGYIMLGYDGIYKTTNGGKNWSSCTINAERDWDFYDMTFTSADTGYVAGFSANHNMLYTTDRGDTWQPVSTPTTSEITKVKFINREKGFIFNKSEIYKTTTSGGLGIKQRSAITHTFNAYPNPFRSALRIDVSGQPITTPYQMSVFNTQGQLLYTTNIQAPTESILFQGSMLNRGIYFLRFTNKGKILGTVKVIKE